MDTRRVAGTRESFGPAAELGTDTGPLDHPKLAEVRSILTVRGTPGLAAVISSLLMLAVITVIAVLAIATNAGWSILDAY
jgi:hypothetical protein